MGKAGNIVSTLKLFNFLTDVMTDEGKVSFDKCVFLAPGDSSYLITNLINDFAWASGFKASQRHNPDDKASLM